MKAGDCRHFTGLMNDACKAGVVYKNVRDESVRPYGLPCLPGLRFCAMTCSKFEAITKAEEKAWMAKVDKALANTMEARARIMKTGHAAGAVDCSVCGKPQSLWFRVASNGHVHAKCRTPDCLAWME